MSASTPRHDGKIFGGIPGVLVGKTWATRPECRMDGVHAMMEHGIHGSSTDGAYSVVLSAGYKDDKDSGTTFIYTGSGGKGTEDEPARRSNVWGPQRSHQTAENHCNQALLMSVNTKRAVRVVRGRNPNSPWAPVKGYRYDGLYIVDEMHEDVGEDGFKVMKFKFRRIEGQPPLSGSSTKDRRDRMLKQAKRNSRG